MRLLVLALLAAATAFPQRISFGVKAGMPASDVFNSGNGRNVTYRPQSGRYLVGPTVELLLPFRFSVEADALYRSAAYRATSAQTVGNAVDLRTTAKTWQFPVLLKYRLSKKLVTPFLDAGFVFNRLTDVKQTGQIAGGLIPAGQLSGNQPPELTRRTAHGYAFGAGLEGKLLFLRLSPEIRYTRWQSDNFQSDYAGFRLANRNQLEVLFGITF